MEVTLHFLLFLKSTELQRYDKTFHSLAMLHFTGSNFSCLCESFLRERAYLKVKERDVTQKLLEGKQARAFRAWRGES